METIKAKTAILIFLTLLFFTFLSGLFVGILITYYSPHLDKESKEDISEVMEAGVDLFSILNFGAPESQQESCKAILEFKTKGGNSIQLCSDHILGNRPYELDLHNYTLIWYIDTDNEDEIRRVVVQGKSEDVYRRVEKFKEGRYEIVFKEQSTKIPWAIDTEYFISLRRCSISQSGDGYIKVPDNCQNCIGEGKDDYTNGIVMSIFGLDTKSTIIIRIGKNQREKILKKTKPLIVGER